MSFEELSKVKIAVPGALTNLHDHDAPASVTRINAQQIGASSARNIYDLIETYVPGAFWMNHESGPHMGIRGIIANRNYKFLLLVNDRPMNNKAYFGAKSELEQWDLDDIARIDVISGPGSVTYGPGAVGGVINIITHSAGSTTGNRTSVRHNNPYGSNSINFSFNHHTSHYNLYAFAGVTQTDGYDAEQFQVTKRNEAGLVGESILTEQVTLDYFTDYDDQPQLKFHLDINFANNWRWWSRYTQQGSTWRGNETQTLFAGSAKNQHSIADRQITSTLEKTTQHSPNLSSKFLFSVDSYDSEQRFEDNNHPQRDHPLNMRQNYAETELFIRGIANWQLNKHTELALGADYSWDHYGKGWGDSARDMRIGENGVIVSGPDSRAIVEGNKGSADRKGEEIFIGNSWNNSSYALFAEGNIQLQTDSTLLLSARADKNNYSDWLYSPRLAFIQHLPHKQTLKAIAQRSVRMNTAGQLFTEDKHQSRSSDETLEGVEFIYSKQLTNSTLFNAAYFRNNIDVIAWQGDINESRSVGELKLHGFEVSLKHSWPAANINLNYAITKQIDWRLDDDITTSGISYADYAGDLGESTQLGKGNDLNNWPNQALKFIGQITFSDALSLQLDAHLLWDFQGSKDGLSGLERAVAGTSDEQDAARSLAEVKRRDSYDHEFRINLSLNYRLNRALESQLFIQNLFGTSDNKRYAYDTGNDDPAPRRVRFVEEPRMFGLKLTYSF